MVVATDGLGALFVFETAGADTGFVFVKLQAAVDADEGYTTFSFFLLLEGASAEVAAGPFFFFRSCDTITAGGLLAPADATAGVPALPPAVGFLRAYGLITVMVESIDYLLVAVYRSVSLPSII